MNNSIYTGAALGEAGAGIEKRGRDACDTWNLRDALEHSIGALHLA